MNCGMWYILVKSVCSCEILRGNFSGLVPDTCLCLGPSGRLNNLWLMLSLGIEPLSLLMHFTIFIYLH